MKQSITFKLAPDAAAIIKRAAAELHLSVIDHRPKDVFVVELDDATDAYRLADLCVQDPRWAAVMLGRRG